MKAASTVREGAEDVYADAKDINEARLAAQEAAVVEDASEAEAPAAEELLPRRTASAVLRSCRKSCRFPGKKNAPRLCA